MSKVHYVTYSSQPYVYLECTKEACYASFGKSDEEGCHSADHPDGKTTVLYTFDKEHVTCMSCLNVQ